MRHGVNAGKYTAALAYEFDEPVNVRNVLMSRDFGIRLVGLDGRFIQPSRTRLETKRARESGSAKPKLLTTSFTDTARVDKDPDHIFSRYDDFLFVDTNTRKFGPTGRSRSVTGLVHAYLSPLQFPQMVRFKEIGAFEFLDPQVDAERLGWATAIDAWKRSNQFPKGRSVALVVDAHYSLLGSIGARETPIVDGCYLSPGWDIVYASADTGRQFSLPYLMHYCDRVSNWFHDLITQRGEEYCSHTEPKRGVHLGFRNWTVTGNISADPSN